MALNIRSLIDSNRAHVAPDDATAREIATRFTGYGTHASAFIDSGRLEKPGPGGFPLLVELFGGRAAKNSILIEAMGLYVRAYPHGRGPVPGWGRPTR